MANTTSLTASDILGAIRDNASKLYMERVPEYDSTNLAQVGKAITEEQNIMNEFLGSLINKIGLSNVKVKMFKNPLARVKGVGIPNGSTIEEIYVNPSVDTGYDKDGTKLLKTTTPDAKTSYYGMNRKGCYPISINLPMIQRGFTNEQEFMSMYNAIIMSMYNGDEIDEFLLTKGVIAKTIDNGGMVCIDVDIADPKGVAKTISAYSSYFMFPRKDLCGYNLVNKTSIDGGETACVTYCRPENQILLINSTLQNEINYEVLASMFHMDVTKLEAITILVDAFPSEKKNVLAVLCDEDAIQMRDYQYTVKSMDNGANLTTNFWLHHWQSIYVSMFGDAVAFCQKETVETGE